MAAIRASTTMHRKLLEGLLFLVNVPGLSTLPTPSKKNTRKQLKAHYFIYLAKLLKASDCYLTLQNGGYTDLRYTGTILGESMRDADASKNFIKTDTSEYFS